MLCELSDIDPTDETPRDIDPNDEDPTDEAPQPTRIVRRLGIVDLPNDYEWQGAVISEPPTKRADDEAPQGCGSEVGGSSLQEAGKDTVHDGYNGGGPGPQSAGSDSSGAACAAASPTGGGDAGEPGRQALAGAPCQWLRRRRPKTSTGPPVAAEGQEGEEDAKRAKEPTAELGSHSQRDCLHVLPAVKAGVAQARPKTSTGPPGSAAVVATEGKEVEEDGKRAKTPTAKLVLQSLRDCIKVLPAVKAHVQAPQKKAETAGPPLNYSTTAGTRTLLQEAHEDVKQAARPRTTPKRAQSQKGCASARGRHIRPASAGLQELCFGVLPGA